MIYVHAYGETQDAIVGHTAKVPLVSALLDAGYTVAFWASPDDTVVSTAHNTTLCAGMARAAGAHVRVITTVGDHGDPSNFDAATLVAFFDAA